MIRILRFYRIKRKKNNNLNIRLLIGLGNPGYEYEGTRHNIGFRVIHELAEKMEVRVQSVIHQALIGEVKMGKYRVILAQPQTYMNRSGLSVAGLQRLYNISPQNILVICDDLDLPIGRLRLRAKGGDGGHRGLRSIIESIRSIEFSRLRIGIGHPPKGEETKDYVLSEFFPEEQPIIQKVVERATEGSLQWILRGAELAMNEINSWRLET